MNVGFIEFSEPVWAKVASQLAEGYGWEPVLWTGERRMEAIVSETFGEGIFLDRARAIRMERSGVLKETSRGQVLPDDWEACAAYQVQAVQMMGRLDPDGQTFSVDDRFDLYYRLTAHWKGVLQALQPDLICFIESPHVVYDYVIYALCRQLGIPVLMPIRTKVEDHVLVSPSFETGPEGVREAVEANRRRRALGEPVELSPALREARAALRATYAQGMPKAAQAQVAAASRQHRGFGFFQDRWATLGDDLRVCREWVRERLSGPSYVETSYLRSSGKEEGGPSKLDYRCFKRKGRRARRVLKRHYEARCGEFDAAKPYVYVPLNYQPEKTSCPDGGWYADLRLMVRTLADALPQDVALCVREHPATFLDDVTGAGRGHMMRSKAFYDGLANLPRVTLISLEEDPFGLIDQAVCVATLTGTAGWEAVNRGKRVICFGGAWYLGCPGVHFVREGESLAEMFAEIRKASSVAPEAVEDYWAAVAALGKPAFINRKRAAGEVMAKENVHALTQLLREGYRCFYEEREGKGRREQVFEASVKALSAS